MAVFAERVDFVYWWSFIGKGLHLQPPQQACFKKKLGAFREFFLGAFEKNIEILCYFWELFQHFGSIQSLFWAF